jgi:hypothetical protein
MSTIVAILAFIGGVVVLCVVLAMLLIAWEAGFQPRPLDKPGSLTKGAWR